MAQSIGPRVGCRKNRQTCGEVPILLSREPRNWLLLSMFGELSVDETEIPGASLLSRDVTATTTPESLPRQYLYRNAEGRSSLPS